MTTYEYPLNKGYADTTAIINGKKYSINTQYGTVECGHDSTCSTRKGLRFACDCSAKVSDDEKRAILADAKVNGKFGAEPVEIKTRSLDEQIAIDKKYCQHVQEIRKAMDEI